MRCGKAEDSFRLSTFPFPEIPSTNFSEEIIDHSRKTYGIPITQLTEKLKQKTQQESEPEGEEEDFWV